MNVPQALPSEATRAGDFARQLAILLGPAYTPADGTKVAADLLALGGALGEVYATSLASIAEAYVDTADELLSELETAYGLPVQPDLSDATRQARLTAKVRALRAGTPQAILASVVTLTGTATLHENTAAAVAATRPAGVYVFAVVIPAAAWNDPTTRAAVKAIVQQMKPAHTKGNVAVTRGFLCDDPNSLTDRDVLAL